MYHSRDRKIIIDEVICGVRTEEGRLPTIEFCRGTDKNYYLRYWSVEDNDWTSPQRVTSKSDIHFILNDFQLYGGTEPTPEWVKEFETSIKVGRYYD